MHGEENETLEEDQDEATWDAAEVMRARARVTRAERDQAISELRDSMSAEEIREEFGLNLSALED